jgi:hypothetical protein
MNHPMLASFRRAAHVAYSRRPPAVLYRAARYFAEPSSDESVGGAPDVLVLPLTLLMLALFLFGSVPGASDIIAASCSIACMP